MRLHRTKRLNRTVAAAGVTAAALALPTVSTVAADATTPLRTVNVTMTAKAISLSSGSSLHAGRYIFRVSDAADDDTLQLLKLTPGYTLSQANKDIVAGLDQGNVAAIRRLDTKVHWLGGVEASPGHPGRFAETLYAGRYYLISQNNPVVKALNVYGAPPAGQAFPYTPTTIVARSGDRFGGASVLPHSGWTLFRDTTDEPHFLSIQHVKSGTTNAQVRAALADPSAQPSWALPEEISTGVISPNTQQLLNYSLPRGEYLLTCWWPSDENGMPHAMMGMWRLVTLK